MLARLAPRSIATFAILTSSPALLLSTPAAAGVAFSYDEAIDGDLASDPSAPTPVAFGFGANTVTGTVEASNAPDGDRDYFTFTIAPGTQLSDINVLAYAPDNIGFASIDEGPTSVVPGFDTDADLLSGVLLFGFNVGSDLLPVFESEAVTTNRLPAARLDPGTYTFLIQQTSPIVQSYALEFVITTECSADFDVSGVVGFADLNRLLAAWGACAGCVEDRDGDGSVGFADLNDLLTAWGPCS